jgi:DNA polymerase-3 subunit alpha
MFQHFLDTMSFEPPLDDTYTYEKVFKEGDTTGIFQFESVGMRRFLIQLEPTLIDNIVAMAALYRPGPMEFIPAYIERRHGREEIEYLYPDLKAELTRKYGAEVAEEERRKLIEDLHPIMKDTYGIAVYQEQLMFLVQAMAGFSLGEADVLRR